MDTREENHIVLASIYRPSSSYIHMPISILFLDVEKESSTLHLSRPLVGFFHLVPDVLLAAPGYWLPDTCFTPAVPSISEFYIIPQTLSNYVTLFEASSEILNSVLMSFTCLEILACAFIRPMYYCAHKVFADNIGEVSEEVVIMKTCDSIYERFILLVDSGMTGWATQYEWIWFILFGLGFALMVDSASALEALVLAYGLNASTWICFLWFEDTSHGYASLLACIWFFLSRLGIGGHLFFNFGTLVLLLHGTFGVQFVQHMTSFHCKLWPFLALLFLLDIIIDFGYPYSSCLVLLFMMALLMIGFYQMVVKRWFVASSSKWLHLELWFPLVG
ncbi:transmembrane protein, putative [Medicago truncatula]|uniref:Transmembrane protein, putative n=1 Tax=Medicago truncatula TaxID=3880 RepID=A0A072UE47_MEDTR|nr:transmembrane protein, putative [Medicago truncatula]